MPYWLWRRAKHPSHEGLQLLYITWTVLISTRHHDILRALKDCIADMYRRPMAYFTSTVVLNDGRNLVNLPYESQMLISHRTVFQSASLYRCMHIIISIKSEHVS